MNKIFSKILLGAIVVSAPLPIFAQKKLTVKADDKKANTLAVSKDSIIFGSNDSIARFSVLTGGDFTVTSEFPSQTSPWLTILKQGLDYVVLKCDYNNNAEDQNASLRISAGEGRLSKSVFVRQKGNNATDYIGDRKLQVAHAEANQTNSGEGIELSIDGKINTFYHSPWNSSSTQFPVILTYSFAKGTHVDYINYVPRQDNVNGAFGSVTVKYALASAPSNFIELKTVDLGMVQTASVIDLGDKGLDNVISVQLVVNTGKNNFACCAEMEFYERGADIEALFSQYFTDKLCTTLKPEVNEETVTKISHPYVKQLVYSMLKDYSKKFRVGKFDAYEPREVLAGRLKTSGYNYYENPTGIFFMKGKSIILFVEGIDSKYPVSLIIKDFGPTNALESTYSLKNGMNIITPANNGNGYIKYFTNDFAIAPKVNIHFAMGKENGYFDLDRGDTNADWTEMLKKACSNIMDMRTKRVQVAYPVSEFKNICPTRGRDLAVLIDSVIWYEHQVMGLQRHNREPKNHMFARVAASGMFADGYGAGAAGIGGWIQPDRANFDFWGFGHELGHVNQLRPGLKWDGMSETTNNIYSAWVQFRLGNGTYRLEGENTGVNDYSGLKGGRYNTYLEENIRKGVNWQLADGPDYHGQEPMKLTVKNQDYAGKQTQDTAVTKRNYDHFVKLAPLWQLLLYTQQCNYSPDAYGKVMEALRTQSDANMSNGMHQVRFMRLFCDSTGMDFTPFFEKAGMLRTYNNYIEDYSPGWLKINQTMIDELKAHVKAKGYKQVNEAIEYISANNWKAYRDKLPVSGLLNEGCTVITAGANKRIQVDHNKWKNVVAFETYDTDGKLLRISMQGLGGPNGSANSYTQVLWPQTATEKAAYIMAVGYDGERLKCYQP